MLVKMENNGGYLTMQIQNNKILWLIVETVFRLPKGKLFLKKISKMLYFYAI